MAGPSIAVAGGHSARYGHGEAFAVVAAAARAGCDADRGSPRRLRRGPAGIPRGADEIKAFRAGRSPARAEREPLRMAITTHGRDLATANTTFRRAGNDRTGRQSQRWVRIPGVGWRVVAAPG